MNARDAITAAIAIMPANMKTEDFVFFLCYLFQAYRLSKEEVYELFDLMNEAIAEGVYDRFGKFLDNHATSIN